MYKSLFMYFILFVQISLFASTTKEELSSKKTAVICGAGGFIGHHLVKRYKKEGYWVRGVDLKYPEFEQTEADEFVIADLRLANDAKKSLSVNGELFPFNEVLQLAANMGGMGFISFHDAEIMHDSALINLHVLEECRKAKVGKVFFSSSACVYPERNQLDPNNPLCVEDSAYPAEPDTEYGWEKLFSERLYEAYANDYGMDIRIARFHNIFGPLGTWEGGREKAPAAICRKVAKSVQSSEIEIWGSGNQTRSFLYIDECVEGIRQIMSSEKKLPILNLGSEEMISINNLTRLIAEIAEKKIEIINVEGPEGVQGRNSDNSLIFRELGWKPSCSLEEGLRKLYPWIQEQIGSYEN